MRKNSVRIVGTVCLPMVLASLIAGQAYSRTTRIIVQGQTVQIAPAAGPGERPVPVVGQQDNVAKNGTATPAEKQGSPDDKKLELLLAAKYERTPEAILKAWSYRATDPLESRTVAQPASGKIVNLWQSIVAIECEAPFVGAVNDVVEITRAGHDGQSAPATVLNIDGKNLVLKWVLKTSVAAEPGSTPQTGPPADPSSPTNAADTASETFTPPIALAAGDVVEVSLSKVETSQTPGKGDTAGIRREVDGFARNVTLGRWADVKAFLATMKPDDAEKVYSHILTSLATASAIGINEESLKGLAPQQRQILIQQSQQNGNEAPATSFLTPDDILQLSEASPKPIQVKLKKQAATPPGDPVVPGSAEVVAETKAAGSAPPVATPAAVQKITPNVSADLIASLGQLISISMQAGNDFSGFAKQLAAGTTHFGLDDPEKKLAAASLLVAAGRIDDVEPFLPDLADEASRADLRILVLWANYARRAYESKRTVDYLDKQWEANHRIISTKDAGDSERASALQTLILLSRQVEREKGDQWLLAAFTEDRQRGMEILSWLGSRSATLARQSSQMPADERLNSLELQNRIAECLVNKVPDLASEWGQILTLLADNWIRESETAIQHSQQTSRGGYMQIDMYGNYYWADPNEMQRRFNGGNQPQPIAIGELLRIAPGNEWTMRLEPSRNLQFRNVIARLHMRVAEEDRAFPYIEQIAAERPLMANDLVEEFLKVWTQNHDPNSERRQRNPYIYFYGYDQKAESIPLTRSKQERNLRELADWVKRIRAMNLAEIDESLLAKAFTTCHSSAEVFHIDRLHSVFGDLKKLRPETTAAISQTMRTNLAGQWRSVRLQEESKTRRREPEVQAEVLRGYETARVLVGESLAAFPENWNLHLALACLMYDENAYRQSVEKSSEFSHRRDTAFAQFERAANHYMGVVDSLDKEKQSNDVFDFWFYAALGAVDLERVTHETLADVRQFPKIRSALESMPPVLAESHMTRFANSLFTRMSPIKPEVKFRYLKAGFEIVGDHPRAWEARALFDYYRDLVSEIHLVAEVDGKDELVPGQAFGVYVNIAHTREIERESGGFGKYVQNQNSMAYAYNYGRPTENYRDKFSDTVAQALEEHFEVVNITFASPDSMESFPAEKEGWRVTPYAYLLLKPRGTQVDRIGQLRLDLDFLDTSGYVVIPIESAGVPVSVTGDGSLPRPATDLKITQTLDERQAREGKLILEISATAKGLVPELDQLLDVERQGFTIARIDDQGVLPSQFDQESSTIQILSERSWAVEYRASDSERLPDEFVFSSPKTDTVTSSTRRYEDADLVEVAGAVPLSPQLRSSSPSMLYWLIPAGLAIAVGGLAFWKLTAKPAPVATKAFSVPRDINPFTVLALLQSIRERNGISGDQSRELDESIRRVEEDWFSQTSTGENADNLEKLASLWVSRTR